MESCFFFNKPVVYWKCMNMNNNILSISVLVQLLLWNGSDVKRLDQDGRSALTYAHSLINTGSQESGANIVEILMHAGCPDPPVGTLARRRDTINRRETISSDIM